MTLIQLPNPHDIKIVAFDLDDTLAPSKSPLPDSMAELLRDLLAVREVLIISGGRFEQFTKQVLDRLPDDSDLSQLHLMPTCGTRYLKYLDGQWQEIYFHALSAAEKTSAITALEKQAKRLGLWEADDFVNGERIEDRGSQITYSALGQAASVADKKAWDPSGEKRAKLRDAVQAELPNLEVRAGGSTSIDITRMGIDKAYGMKALRDVTGVGLDEMLFIGDRLMPGGNDYPVAELGVDCHQVADERETEAYLKKLIPLLKETR